jgi:L-2-hydroxyglutarate oxidase LhgO
VGNIRPLTDQVIHAGFYYGIDSLKAALCIKGKHMLYDVCSQQRIPHRGTKKWILAQDNAQLAELEKIHCVAQALDIPTKVLTRHGHQEQEPEVRAQAGVLERASTGIVDSHSLMSYLEGDFLHRGGDQALHTIVTRIEVIRNGQEDYQIWTKSQGSDEETIIEVETLINSAGFGAIPLSNMGLPPERHRRAFYA